MVDPSGHNAVTKTSDIALRHEGFNPIESGSTRDTAPPATELIPKLVELKTKPLLSELNHFRDTPPSSDSMILAAFAGSDSAKLRGSSRDATSFGNPTPPFAFAKIA